MHRLRLCSVVMGREATGDGFERNPRTVAALKIRLTRKEREKLDMKARKLGKSTSAYVREVALRDARF